MQSEEMCDGIDDGMSDGQMSHDQTTFTVRIENTVLEPGQPASVRLEAIAEAINLDDGSREPV